jgi:2-polyprenyl-3-methyl-5-hydroxy-6-metoxy-1,4-benzoquinol methylase
MSLHDPMKNGPVDVSKPLEWTNELVGRFWSFQAQNRPEDFFTHLFGNRMVSITEPYIPKGSTILDFGCGSGFLLQRLISRYPIAGYDWASANIEATRSRVGNHPNLIRLYAGERGEQPVGPFGVVYLVETVEHILESQLSATLSHVASLVAAGGIVIATTPNDEDLEASTVYCPCCKHTFHRWQHIRSLSEQGMTALFGKHGFEAMAVFSTDFSAKGRWQQFKTTMRPYLGRKNPHLVYIGRRR